MVNIIFPSYFSCQVRFKRRVQTKTRLTPSEVAELWATSNYAFKFLPTDKYVVFAWCTHNAISGLTTVTYFRIIVSLELTVGKSSLYFWLKSSSLFCYLHFVGEVVFIFWCSRHPFLEMSSSFLWVRASFFFGLGCLHFQLHMQLKNLQNHKLTHTQQNFNFLSSLLANHKIFLGDGISPTLPTGNILKSQDYRVIWSQNVHFVTI